MQFLKDRFTPKPASYLSGLTILAALATLTLSLVSCGGGGGSGGGTTTPAITSITPVGIVQSSVARTVTLFGTNFTSSMTLTVTDSTGATPYTIGTTTYTASNSSLKTSVMISAAPTDRYVKVNVKSGSTTVATTVLGVAQSYKTLSSDIQPILDANCTGCHDGMFAAQGAPDFSTAILSSGNKASVDNLINANSTGCSTRLRVKPGDPRRASSVLVDKILALSTGIPACHGVGMPNGGTSLSVQNILDIEDWIAAGAY